VNTRSSSSQTLSAMRNVMSSMKSLQKKEERALFDVAAIAHERDLHPWPVTTNRAYPFWDTSHAKVLLSSDVNEGNDHPMSSQELWNS
jgi:hypothetical protein